MWIVRITPFDKKVLHILHFYVTINARRQHFMERKMILKLLKWKNNPNKQPLLLQGARQVGKTYTLLTFGKSYYKNVVYVNMEKSMDYIAVFHRDLDPYRIIHELEVLTGQTIIPKDTLLIIDEIQACEQALTSLKYFAEEASEFHVVAAGRLLGVAMKRGQYSFPVCKVDMLYLHPMDFEEFLWALGEKKFYGLIKESYISMTQFSYHEKALDLYKLYLVIGGLPRVVADYVEKKDFDFVRVAQNTLNDSYIADMAKYATVHETTRIMGAWNSIPSQLAKENKKFIYKVIRSGARGKDYENALDWLNSAGMINKCVKVSLGYLPLISYEEIDAFKLYMVDTGLLCSKFDLPPSSVLHAPVSFNGFKGALTENYVMQALICNGYKPYYWTSNGKAEIDFLFQDREGNIIPVEVKADDHVKSKSLDVYREKFEPNYAIRISSRNFGFVNKIKSIPLYAVSCIDM